VRSTTGILIRQYSYLAENWFCTC